MSVDEWAAMRVVSRGFQLVGLSVRTSAAKLVRQLVYYLVVYLAVLLDMSRAYLWDDLSAATLAASMGHQMVGLLVPRSVLHSVVLMVACLAV